MNISTPPIDISQQKTLRFLEGHSTQKSTQKYLVIKLAVPVFFNPGGNFLTGINVNRQVVFY